MVRKNQNKLHEIKRSEPELLKNFINYWSLRKGDPFAVEDVIKQLKKHKSETWMKLIKSNQNFRSKYGEEIANELIEIIQENNTLTNKTNDFLIP